MFIFINTLPYNMANTEFKYLTLLINNKIYLLNLLYLNIFIAFSYFAIVEVFLFQKFI